MGENNWLDNVQETSLFKVRGESAKIHALYNAAHVLVLSNHWNMFTLLFRQPEQLGNALVTQTDI